MRIVVSALFVLLALGGLGCGSAASGADAAVVADALVGDDAPSVDAFVGDASSVDAAPRDAATIDAASAGGDASRCQAAVDAVIAAAPGVLFLSESDRPIEVRVFAGEGNTAPTIETVTRLLAPPGTVTAEMRDAATYAVHFEPAGTDATTPDTLRAAVEAALTDTIYVAFHDSDPLHTAEVRVILAGRSACGDLVMLDSISIET